MRDDRLSFRSHRPRRRVPEVVAETGLVVEDAEERFCGAVVGFESGSVVLADRAGRRRLFPLTPAGFLIDGEPVTLLRPASEPGSGRARSGSPVAAGSPHRTASGSIAVAGAQTQVARASRIWVEGIHDATLVERIWGDDLRIEGIVVEPLEGIDSLESAVHEFDPGPQRRLGVLVDHLVPGSKENRIADAVSSGFVLVTGHPYVDIWEAVKPDRVGIRAWPSIPPGQDWKEGVCAALGVSDPAEMWRRVRSGVHTYHDLETPLVNAVERLIDFVADPPPAALP